MRTIQIVAFAALMALYLAACDYAAAGLPWASALALVNQVVMQLTPS